MTFHLQAEALRARREQIATNSPSLAKCHIGFTQHGTGTAITDAVDFDVAFLEEPVFGWGSVLASGDSLIDPPTGYAGVYGWNVDANGIYRGVRLYFKITGGDQSTVMHHTISFEGRAFKELSSDIIDALS